MGRKRKRLWPEVSDAAAAAAEPGKAGKNAAAGGAVIIDNHTHLPMHRGEIPRDSDRVRLPLTEQLARAAGAGVAAVVSCACDIADVRAAAQLMRRWPQGDPACGLPDEAETYREWQEALSGVVGDESDDASRAAVAGEVPEWNGSRPGLPRVYWAVAIHPNEAAIHGGYREVSPDGLAPNVKDFHALTLEEAVAEVEAVAREFPDDVVAIGETGIDLYRTGPAGLAAQQAGMRAHIALAKELGLPLQIHDREAHAQVVELLLAEGAPERTVFHCFSGDEELARICNEQGWYASFAGPITYPANDALRMAAAVMDPALIMVETDAPYLTPAPWRGSPNASYCIEHTVRELAAVRQTSFADMCERLAATTREVYRVSL